MIMIEDLFKPNQEESIVNENNGAASVKKIAFRKKTKIDNRDAEFEQIISSTGMPNKNECLILKSNGLSDTGSIFKYIAKQADLNELYLSTWIISRDNIDLLISLIEKGKLKQITFIVSNRLKQLKKSDYAHLVEQFKKHPQQIKFRVCNSHAKTFSVSDCIGNHYTVTGSGNWTMNPRIENYIILNDVEAFKHNKNWMSELI